MAKHILTGLDLLALPSLITPKTGSVGFGAKSNGLYQKVGTVESKLSTTTELLDRVKTAVPLNAKFTDTTYGVATAGANGLMGSADKSKLDGIEADANKTTLSTSISSTSTTTAATSSAVRLAYNRGSTGITNAATAQSKADSVNERVSEIDETISASLNDLNMRIKDLETIINNL